MSRKRITQIFPFLLPIREWQRKQFCKISNYFDKNIYAYEKGNLLRFEVNTIPGCTSHSRFPAMLNYIGYDFSKMIDTIIELGMNRKKS